MMDLRIPAEGNLPVTSGDDPAPYYYKPLLRYPYLMRLRIALALFGDKHLKRILDIGYGSGVLFPELARRCDQLTGIDLHRSGVLVQGMMQHEGLNGQLSVGDVGKLPFKDGSFDGVICLSVLEFVTDLQAAIAEICRIMPVGGIAILGAPVLNRITGLAYEQLIRHMQHRDQHKSDHRLIRRAAYEHFEIVDEKRFLSFLPRDYAFFFCLSCKKT